TRTPGTSIEVSALITTTSATAAAASMVSSAIARASAVRSTPGTVSRDLPRVGGLTGTTTVQASRRASGTRGLRVVGHVDPERPGIEVPEALAELLGLPRPQQHLASGALVDVPVVAAGGPRAAARVQLLDIGLLGLDRH